MGGFVSSIVRQVRSIVAPTPPTPQTKPRPVAQKVQPKAAVSGGGKTSDEKVSTMRRRRGGRTQTQLSGTGGVTGTAPVATKRLLGE